MREIVDDLEKWHESGREVAIACVVKTWGSSPRVPGSMMAVSSDMQIAGSVSGGCIEGEVVRSSLECIEDKMARVERFHASTKRAREVGLSCGGNIDIVVAPVDWTLFELEKRLIGKDCGYYQVTYLGEPGDDDTNEIAPASFLLAKCGDARPWLDAFGEDALGVPVIGREDWCIAMSRQNRFGSESGLLIQRVSQAVFKVSDHGATGNVIVDGKEFFYCERKPRPSLICVGGVHIAIRLTEMAKALGYRTVVIDPRGVFSAEERFPSVDLLVHAWPQEAFEEMDLNEASAVCALTHDPKIDVPALGIALDSPAFYIGSLGRPSTQLARCRQLRECGWGDESIARIYGPIGLDLRGREPSEISLSIMAEITAVRHGSSIVGTSMLQSARKAEREEQLQLEQVLVSDAVMEHAFN